jgi:hypothetical protein
MARPMHFIRTGSPKEDIVAKLMRTAFLIGLAATWRPGAAAAQYSWSNFSVAASLGTGSASLGIGASYTAVDPLYDVYFEDPCWDYAYYEWYRHACHSGYDRIHVRHNYSVVSVNPYYRPRRPHYYSPYRYSSHTHFSLSWGVSVGYGYPYSYYGSPYYSASYPGYGYGYAAYGYPYYGYPAYGYPAHGYPAYRYAEDGVAYLGGNRTAGYKESPASSGQTVVAARSVNSRRATATRSYTGQRTSVSRAMGSVGERSIQPTRRPARVASPNRPGVGAASARANPAQRSRAQRTDPTSTDATRVSRAQTLRESVATLKRRPARARPSDAVLRGAAARTDGLSARRGNSTRLSPLSRGTTRRPARSINPEPGNTTERSSPTSGAAQARPEAVTRSRVLRERAPAPKSTPDARRRTSNQPQANRASPGRGRATQRSAAPRATAPRSAAPRARASTGRASRGAASARATAPTRSRSMQRPRR